LINNAGIMQIDDVSGTIDDKLITSTITTNLMGPIRLTSVLIEHLKKHNSAYIINVSSVLGFVPLALAAVYCSTKAALHSYSLSLRYKLGGTSVKVLEVAPPWVQTDLLNSNEEPRAMPLREFIDETMQVMSLLYSELHGSKRDCSKDRCIILYILKENENDNNVRKKQNIRSESFRYAI